MKRGDKVFTVNGLETFDHMTVYGNYLTFDDDGHMHTRMHDETLSAYWSERFGHYVTIPEEE